VDKEILLQYNFVQKAEINTFVTDLILQCP